MKTSKATLFVVLLSSLVTAQTLPNTSADSAGLVEQVKRLQQSMVDQQQTMADQQKQLVEERQELERLEEQLNAQTLPAASTTNRTSPPSAELKESPLSFRIGGADFTPGGFVDFTTIFRTTNTGNGGGTNFFAIPYSNAVAGHMSEVRLTAQNSRLALKAHDAFGRNDVTAYLEMDFLGNDASNVFVSSNSHTLRQRLYFIDLKRAKWEILAGQAWSWLTPNRVGLSSITSDVFYSLNEDFNYQVGLTWTRAPQVRVAYHPDANWAFGLALENPQQFGGQGELTFPASFNSQLGSQIDQGAGNTTPNLHPDVIPKVAYDNTIGGRHYHAEVAALLTSMRIADLPEGQAAFIKHSKTGGGIEAAVNLEFVKNVRFVANSFWSDGGGRYIFGMGPDGVVLPNAAGTDVDLSLVHSGSGIAGFEAQVMPKTMLFGYYGAAYFQRNFALDTTPDAKPGTFVGFGFPDSGSNNNRAIQEPTIGWVQTFWKSPQFGALQFITQVSYVTRSPWFVPAAAPKNAHLTMTWVDLRYVLP